MRIKIVKNYLLLLMALLVISEITLARSYKKKILIATGDYPPFIGQDLPNFGLATSFLREIFSRAGYEIELAFYPWPRVQKMIEDGEAVASYSWVKNTEREGLFEFSKFPILRAPVVVFYKKSRFPNGINFENYESLKNKKMTGIRGFWYITEFERLKIDTLVASSMDQVFRLLDSERVDAFVEILQVGNEEAKKRSDLAYSEMKQGDSFQYLIFSKKHKDAAQLKIKIDAALESAHKDGTFKRMYR